MRFLSSHELNKNKWDALVEQAGGNHFSFSFFLDATAKNWGVFTDEHYTKGFAVCYNFVLGVSFLYPPIFGRTVDFLKLSEAELKTIPNLLRAKFKSGYLQSEIPLDFGAANERLYQVYDPEKAANTLSKRMLKKAAANDYRVESAGFRPVLPLIKSQLSGKVRELHDENITRLEHLLTHLEAKNRLWCSGIFNAQNELCGGMFFALSPDKVTYIIGTANESCRNAGGMYLCMEHAIREAAANKKTFDFGGSSIESIRRFYIALGGRDVTYFAYSWDNSPAWYRLIRNLKKKL